MNKLIITGIAAVLLAGTGASARNRQEHNWKWNAEGEYTYSIQALLGFTEFRDLLFKETSKDGTTTVETDISTVPQLGGAWATMPKGKILQYGLECNFLLGFQVDEVSGHAGGGSLYMKVECSMWMIDLAGGPYLNIPLGRWGRIYGAAGPLLTYIDYDIDREEKNTVTGTEEKYNNSESAFGAGFYARTGIEFRVRQNGYLGLGARWIWAHTDFDSIDGTDDLNGIGGFVTYTAGF